MAKQPVIFRDLGQMNYKAAWDYQENLLQQNLNVKSKARSEESILDDSFTTHHPMATCLPAGKVGTSLTELETQNYLLFVEHPPVFTLGKSGNINNVLLSEEKLNEKGIEFFRTNRGGDITFHGLQQIVGYPILDLEKFDTDIGHYLRNLEEVIILTLADYGIDAGRSKGETGVWIDPGTMGRE